MTDTPNTPNTSNGSPSSSPIILELEPDAAAALMAVTRSYSAVASFPKRLDYCIAELAFWQGQVHTAYLQGFRGEALTQAVNTTNEAIEQLIEFSIREGLS